MAMIACVDLDPFLVDMIRRLRPQDTVRAIEGSALAPGSLRRYRACVLPARSPALSTIRDPRVAGRTVLIVRRGAAVPPSHPGPVLRRPVDVSELRVALASVLPAERFGRLSDWLRGLPTATSSEGVFGVARVAAVATASGLALTAGPAAPPAGLVALLFAWSLLRVWVRALPPALVVADIVTVAAVMALTPGGPTGPFILYAAVVAGEVGYALPSRAGAIVVGLGTVAGLVPIVLDVVDGTATADEVVGWGALIPLSSVIGVLAARIREGREEGNVALLRELNATLDRLSKQAQGAAGTLDTTSVLDQIMASMRDDVRAVAGVVLLGDDQVHEVATSFGLVEEPPRRLILPNAAARQEVPVDIAGVLPRGCEVLVASLRASGVHEGALVACVPGEADIVGAREELVRLAQEAVLALDNARLFAGIRELTIDEERRRIARDLHDGVIQSLVHVRFELDLVQRMLDHDASRDIARLRDVVGQAVDEVRGTVNDLRSVRLSAGLGTALAGLARELERPGLRVVVDAAPTEDLTPEGALQLLRIAQEAVSNAIQHGQASVIVLRLWQDSTQVHLQVLDDGRGLEGGVVPADRGVGLRAMQERADLIGADLDLGPGADGGTCVQVDVPLGG